MSNFIKIILKPTTYGVGGSFYTKASFKIDNIPLIFTNTTVKIDTGASLSMIPLNRFNVIKPSLKYLKELDLNNGVNHIFSYGIESGGTKHNKPVTHQDFLDCKDINFEHIISNFEISGVKIKNDKTYVNYDRSGNILIGMDILEQWDIHTGKNKNGDYIFLGCPYDQINDEYVLELENTFHLASIINTTITREKIAMDYPQSF